MSGENGKSNGKGGAQPGNNYALKFKTSEERQHLCDEFCKHMRQGLSKESFPHCDPQTLRRYMRDFPNDFDTEKMIEAERQGRLFWEKIGIAGAVGLDEVTLADGSTRKLKGFNAASWIFNMKNRYGWRDRVDVSGHIDMTMYAVVDEMIRRKQVAPDRLRRLAEGEDIEKVFPELAMRN